MKDFRNLKVWERAHDVTLEVYRATRSFPREELNGLTSQTRRCSASIAANIAEGCGRRGNGEFHRFLQIASGSASELDYHLLLARDLGFLENDAYEAPAQQTCRTSKDAHLADIAGRHRTLRGQMLSAKC